MPLPCGRLLHLRPALKNLQALRTATGCTQDTNIQHLHDETLILPIHEHLQLHASQYKQETQHPSHPLHEHTTYFNAKHIIIMVYIDMLSIIVHATCIHHSNVCNIYRNSCILVFNLYMQYHDIIFILISL